MGLLNERSFVRVHYYCVKLHSRRVIENFNHVSRVPRFFFLNEHARYTYPYLFLVTWRFVRPFSRVHSGHELWKFIPRVLLHYAIPMVPKLAYGNTSVPAVSIISGRISRFKSRQRRRQLQFHFPAKGPHTRVLFPRRFRRWRRWYRPRRPIKNVSANRTLRIWTPVKMWILTCPFAQRDRCQS